MNHGATAQMSQEMQNCIQECSTCHTICLSTVSYCLEQVGKHAEPAHIKIMLDCAEICQTSANFMLRGSEMHAKTCGVCAEACRRCAESCEKMGDDQQMKACAEECRRCEASCREMANMAA